MRSLSLVVMLGCGGAAPRPDPEPPTPTIPFCDQVREGLRQPLTTYRRPAGGDCLSLGAGEEAQISCRLSVPLPAMVELVKSCLVSYRAREDNGATVIEVDWPDQPKREVRIVTTSSFNLSEATFTVEPLRTVAVSEPPAKPYVPTPRPPPNPPDERITKIIGRVWRGTSESSREGSSEKVNQLHELQLRIVEGDVVTGTLKTIRRIAGKSYVITNVVSGELYGDRKRIRLETYKRVQADELPAGTASIGWCGYKLDLAFADTYKGKPIPEGIYKLEVTSSNICKHTTENFEFVILANAD